MTPHHKNPKTATNIITCKMVWLGPTPLVIIKALKRSGPIDPPWQQIPTSKSIVNRSWKASVKPYKAIQISRKIIIHGKKPIIFSTSLHATKTNWTHAKEFFLISMERKTINLQINWREKSNSKWQFQCQFLPIKRSNNSCTKKIKADRNQFDCRLGIMQIKTTM